MCLQAPQFRRKYQSDDVESEPIEPTRHGLRGKSRQDESFPISVGSQPPLPRDSLINPGSLDLVALQSIVRWAAPDLTAH